MEKQRDSNKRNISLLFKTVSTVAATELLTLFYHLCKLPSIPEISCRNLGLLKDVCTDYSRSNLGWIKASCCFLLVTCIKKRHWEGGVKKIQAIPKLQRSYFKIFYNFGLKFYLYYFRHFTILSSLATTEYLRLDHLERKEL
jgi:hypothetical protein